MSVCVCACEEFARAAVEVFQKQYATKYARTHTHVH